MVIEYEKKVQITAMFNAIASKYDFLNHLLSFGIDKRWRRRLIKELSKRNASSILDVATGTGDLAILAAKNTDAHITGIDIAGKMIEIGKKKIEHAQLNHRISFLLADAEKLPFPDNSFDNATVAFGVRNFSDLDKGIAELSRVVKNNGEAFILEFSIPKNKIWRMIYLLYFHTILPFLGRLISGNIKAYRYLPRSVNTFPFGARFQQIVTENGFNSCRTHSFAGGIAMMYIAKKNI
jgi:demethylmenaquinone methyltransferase/2-methoxy-6-polyprenyl-1,4-benzoquinol methylase